MKNNKLKKKRSDKTEKKNKKQLPSVESKTAKSLNMNAPQTAVKKPLQ